MDTIHILFRRARPQINIKGKLSAVRKTHKQRKQDQRTEDIFRKFNNTIHHAAPIIEYAVDAASSKLSKKKASRIHSALVSETTTFIYKSLKESSTVIHSNFDRSSKKRSNFYDEIFSTKNWSSQKIIFGIIALAVIIIFITLFLTRLFFNKNQNELRHSKEIQDTDSLRTSFRSTISSIQE